MRRARAQLRWNFGWDPENHCSAMSKSLLQLFHHNPYLNANGIKIHIKIKIYQTVKFLTSPESLLLRSGMTRVFLLLPGAIVEPILILGPTNMYRLSPDLYWML